LLVLKFNKLRRLVLKFNKLLKFNLAVMFLLNTFVATKCDEKPVEGLGRDH
jgi:hypothetical protein